MADCDGIGGIDEFLLSVQVVLIHGSLFAK